MPSWHEGIALGFLPNREIAEGSLKVGAFAIC